MNAILVFVKTKRSTKHLMKFCPSLKSIRNYSHERNPYESKTIAEDYAKYRPVYPRLLAERVIDFSQDSHQTSKQELLIDVGCGTGQSTTIFYPYFKRIVAIDISVEQIKQAKQHNTHNNVTYVQGFEDYIPSIDKSADVIVSGSAVHWFNLPSFFDEVRRVLKPTGCLAIFGYWTPVITPLFASEEALSEKVTEQFEEAVLGSVSDDFIKTSAYVELKNRYEDIYRALPFKNKQRFDDIYITEHYSVNQLRGYMKSSDSYQPYIDKKTKELIRSEKVVDARLIASIDYVEVFLNYLKSVWKTYEIQDDEVIMRLEYKCFLLLAKNQA